MKTFKSCTKKYRNHIIFRPPKSTRFFVLCYCTAFAWLVDLVASWDSPVSVSSLPIGALGLQMDATKPNFYVGSGNLIKVHLPEYFTQRAISQTLL